MSLCECGRPIRYPSTGECRTCYMRRFRGGYKRVLNASGVDVRPCSYEAAHRKVRRVRGRAADMACVDCTERMARDWSYNNTSELEQRDMHHGYPRRWSPNPDDYAPRCGPCHYAYDRVKEKVNG